MVKTRVIPEFELECGAVLRQVPVGYSTWGALNEARDNAVVVGHSLTSTTDAADWWRGCVGPGAALDTDRYFVVCLNVIGSPYGSVSPVTTNPDTGRPYGPDLPQATVRDTVALHKLVLDALGVRGIAFVIGGSMGGMQVLEWAFYGDFVRGLVPIGVGGRHSAWCIAWSEAQRQAIFRDAAWNGGRYDPASQPVAGLSVARMIAMISYRSSDSFASRFGRTFRNGAAESVFNVESYLHHHGDKLVQRFDANCYVYLTRLMDSHDVARGRGTYEDVLASIAQPTLVVGIESDVLYTLGEQEELASLMPRARLAVMEAAHGHDTFLIEVDALGEHIRAWRQECVDA